MRILGLLLTLLLLSLFDTSAGARGHGGARGRAVVVHRHAVVVHRHNNFFAFFAFPFFAGPVSGNQIVPPLVSPIQPTFGSVLIVADGRGGFARHTLSNSGGAFGFGNGGFFTGPVPGNQIVPPLVSPIQPTLARSVFIVSDGHGGFATHALSNSGGMFRFVNGSMVEANAGAAPQVVVERHGGHESHSKMIVFDSGTRG
jgi:hypothetical protein